MFTRLHSTRFAALYLAMMMTALTTLLTAQLFSISPADKIINPVAGDAGNEKA